MNKGRLKAALGCLLSGAIICALGGSPDMPPKITPGFYLGIGGSWNTVRTYNKLNVYNGSFPTGINAYGFDQWFQTFNVFAPMANIGYWGHFNAVSPWLWGLQFNYKYLDWKTPGVVSAPNALTALANGIVGGFHIAQVRNRLRHEFLLLAYFGRSFSSSYLYLGAGATALTVRNTFFATGSRDQSTDVPTYENNISRTIAGWAAQIGYNYYVTPTAFLSLNYTYIGTAWHHFDVTTNRAAISGNVPTANGVVYANRSATYTVQEAVFSINKVF